MIVDIGGIVVGGLVVLIIILAISIGTSVLIRKFLIGREIVKSNILYYVVSNLIFFLFIITFPFLVFFR